MSRLGALLLVSVAASLFPAAAGAQSADVVAAPTGIAADCSVDVTNELTAWIESVPDGSALRLAPGGCYRIDGTVVLRDRTGLVLDGAGATLRAGSEGDQARRHVRILGGRDVTVRDLVVRGAQPNTRVGPEDYREDRAFQHGFDLRGVSDVTLDHVRVYDVFGDFVYVGPASGQPSTDVTVVGSRFVGSGRQGIAVTAGERLAFRDNEILGVAMAVFDLEPNRANEGVRDVDIVDNVTGRAAGFWLLAPATGIVADVSVTGNVMRSRTAGLIWVIGAPGALAGPVSISDNRFLVGDAVYATNAIGAFYFERCQEVSILGNHVRFPRATDVRAVDTTACQGVTVDGNTFLGAVG